MNRLFGIILGAIVVAAPAAAEPAPAKLTWVTRYEVCEEQPVVFEGVDFRHAGNPDPAVSADMLQAVRGAVPFSSTTTLVASGAENFYAVRLRAANIIDFARLVAYLNALPPTQKLHVRVRFQRPGDGRSDDLSLASFKEFSGAGCS